MDNIQEFRYPFYSVFEFFTDGYWLEMEGIHLSLGWVILAFYTMKIFYRKESLYVKFSTIYFSAFIFNNYAYSFLNIRFSEYFGILAAFTSFMNLKVNKGKSTISYLLIGISFLSLVHALIISVIYPDINPTTEHAFLRLALILKILVLGLVFLSFNNEFNTIEKVERLIQDIVVLACISCLLYLLQFYIFMSGILPFGTFLDAGFTGFPTFGSVSIERGHFAKLLVPLFPFFSFQLINKKAYISFAVFTLISIINFSASGQLFFLSYLLIFLFFNLRKIMIFKYYFMAVLVLFPVSTFTIIYFNEQFIGIIDKIRTLAFEGADIGGRGVDVLAEYSSRYPLGISYGGSTLRIVNNLPEINSGINAFIAQYSFLGIIIASLFLYINLYVYKASLKVRRKKHLQPFHAGILVSIIIYCSDILWFTPTIWLSLVLCNHITILLLERRDNKKLAC